MSIQIIDYEYQSLDYNTITINRGKWTSKDNEQNQIVLRNMGNTG